MHTSIHSGGTGKSPGIPHAMVLTLIARSPRRRIPFASVVQRIMTSHIPVGLSVPPRGLTPTTGARTTRLHVRNNAARLARLFRPLTNCFATATSLPDTTRRVHRIPPVRLIGSRTTRSAKICASASTAGAQERNERRLPACTGQVTSRAGHGVFPRWTSESWPSSLDDAGFISAAERFQSDGFPSSGRCPSSSRSLATPGVL